MERRTDERISEWFREEAERISVPADMKTEIDRRIRNAERRTVMKKFSRKKAVLIAAAVALIGSVTAAAAGRVASMKSHSNRNDQVTDYAAIAGVEEKVGFAFPSLEEFSNGFRFAYALPGENSEPRICRICGSTRGRAPRAEPGHKSNSCGHSMPVPDIPAPPPSLRNVTSC